MTKNLKKTAFSERVRQATSENCPWGPAKGFELMELNPVASFHFYHKGDTPLTKQEIEASLRVAENIASWAKIHTSP